MTSRSKMFVNYRSDGVISVACESEVKGVISLFQI